MEWARLTGRVPAEREKAKARRPELPHTSRARAGADDSGTLAKPTPELTDQYARAYEFAGTRPSKSPRARCGAKRHRDGQPCEARPEPGKRRCRFHGGRSTGPRTGEGKARAMANLRRGRTPAAR
ncbi:MAG: HGGxSTG domain-containing protein [Luteimonas sp.]